MTVDTKLQIRTILSEVHAYWFGTFPTRTHLPDDKKDLWFTQSDATDAHIREHFLEAVGEAAAADWDIERLSKQEQVALIVLLDQFPRNLFRGTASAFDYDAKALKIARHLVSQGLEGFALIERMFIAIPFEHSEEMADQDIAVWLMAGIAVDAAEAFPAYARWALDSFITHRAIIREFGRFPYRNAALGRKSTAEEMAFLAQKTTGNSSNPTEGLKLSKK
jgi:uncharacterized protein (DUF924 family)